MNGYHDRRSANPDQRFRTIVDVVPHPKYDDSIYYNDLMLLKLDKPVGDITFVELNRRSDLPALDEDVTVMGLGALLETGGYPGTLQSVDVDVIDRTFCNDAYVDVGFVSNTLRYYAMSGQEDGCSKGRMSRGQRRSIDRQTRDSSWCDFFWS